MSVQWWKTGARLPWVLPRGCSSASLAVLAVRGTWPGMRYKHPSDGACVGQGWCCVPPGPQWLSRCWSWWDTRLQVCPVKPCLSPRGDTMSGAAPHSALQPGWHEWWRSLSRHLFVPVFASVEADCFTAEKCIYFASSWNFLPFKFYYFILFSQPSKKDAWDMAVHLASRDLCVSLMGWRKRQHWHAVRLCKWT